MGAGIAQVLAHKGKYNVTLSDVTDKALDNGRSIISKSLTRIAKKSMADSSAADQEAFVKQIVDGIKTTTDAGAAVAETDLVIEAIIENVGIKKDLFSFLDGKAPKDAIFASNTSSLSITDVAAATERKDRFGGKYACSGRGKTDLSMGTEHLTGTIACTVLTQRPLFLGFHAFNPVPQMKCVNRVELGFEGTQG